MQNLFFIHITCTIPKFYKWQGNKNYFTQTDFIRIETWRDRREKRFTNSTVTVFNLTEFTKLKYTANRTSAYLATPEDSSGTTTLRLQATRSRSVAISLLGALLCIWRTPSICPLRLNPIFGGEWTSEVELTDAKKDQKAIVVLHWKLLG